MESFGSLFTQYGSDKDTDHSYGRIYDRLFPSNIRLQINNVLEIGVLEGASLRAFAAAFPNALIEGWDLKPVNVTGDRIHVRTVNAVTPTSTVAIDQKFDLIVDDGSHFPNDQAVALCNLWSFLQEDGLYVIEDVMPNVASSEIIRLAGLAHSANCYHVEFDLRHVRQRNDDRLLILSKKPISDRLTSIRVLFASHDLSLSGAPILLVTLIPHIRGIEPVLYSPCDGPLKSRLLKDNIPITHELDLKNIDVVVANTIVNCPVAEAALQNKVPLIWMIHESDPSLFPQHHWAARLLPQSFRVIFPCHSSAVAYAPYCQSVTEVISFPVEQPSNEERERRRSETRQKYGMKDEFVILNVGSIESRKGQSDLVRIAHQLSAKIFLVGRILDPNEVAGAPQNVVLVPPTETPSDFFAAADLYVCCSRIEAFPLTIMEAAAHRLPIITTPVHGTRDQIHEDYHGVYYPPGDTEELRKKIIRIQHDVEWRKSIIHPLDHLPEYGESVHLMENILVQAAGQGSPPRLRTGKPRVVYHVAGMGNWRENVHEQLRSLKRSQLGPILATHVGEDPRWLLEESTRQGIDLILCQHDDRLECYETLAMQLIERIAATTDDPIIYLHTKGVSKPSNLPASMWRRLMQRQVIERWRENLDFLNDHDVVGVNWWYERDHHFSGNFWIARADWIRRLPDFTTYHNTCGFGRYSCERWIGATPGARAKSLICHDRKFWIDGVAQG